MEPDVAAGVRKPYVEPRDRTYRWSLECAVKRRVDADTLVVVAQLPVQVTIEPLGISQVGRLPHEIPLRLDGIDAWEDETPPGQVAVAFVDEWVAGRATFRLASSFKRDRYYRVLGQLVSESDVLAQLLLDAGHARRWT